MKKLLKIMLCLLVTAISSGAQLLIDDSFDSYGTNVDIDGQDFWSATTNDSFVVTTNELFLAMDGQTLSYTNSVELMPGDTVEITLDHRYNQGVPAGNFSLFNVGMRGNGQGISCYASYNNWQNGAIKYFPDVDQWWTSGQPNVRADTVVDMGSDPKPNVGPVADPLSDPLQIVYTITKSHVTNEFNSEVTFYNAASNITKSASKSLLDRSDIWASTNVSFFLSSVQGISRASYVYFDKVKVEVLPPTAAPTGVSPLPLDMKVQVSWDSMIGATEYDVYRGTSAGAYDTTNRIAGTSYEDTGVENDTTYYYAVGAVYYNGVSAASDEVEATPKKVFSDDILLATDFSGDSLGDLAGSSDWNALSGSGSNAFAVVSDVVNKADTAATMSDFDMNKGNAVFADYLAANETDDMIEGYFDVVINTTPSVGTPDTTVLDPTTYADFSNQGVMEFGITSSSTESLNVAKKMMAMFHISVRHNANIIVMFGKSGNDTDSNRLAALGRDLCGWNPKDNAWDSPGGTADLATDALRVSWKIRKTREAGVYQAWASISNTVTAATSESRADLLEFELLEGATEMYESPAAYFAMGHSYRAHEEYKSSGTNRVSMLNATVLEVSVEHSPDNLPELRAPVVDTVIPQDRGVQLGWNDVLEATGYDVLMETGEDSYVVVTNIQGTSYTDTPRWNDVTNFYTIRANYYPDTPPGYVDSTVVTGVPLGMVKIVDMDGSRNDLLDTTDTAKKFYLSQEGAVTNAGADITYLDRRGATPMIANGEMSGDVTYNGYTIYALTQRPATNGISNRHYIENDNAVGQRYYLSGGWNASAPRQLAYIELDDMDWADEAPTGIDATSQLLSFYLGMVSYTDGNGGWLYPAIRNGSQWYVGAVGVKFNTGGSGAKDIRVSDVMTAAWKQLDPVVDELMDAGADLNDNAVLTDINAVGWFAWQASYMCMSKFEVQTFGAQSSYNFWADSQGLVSSNSAAADDPDMDGLLNEKEFAFGGDPLVADTATLPQFSTSIYVEEGTGDEFFTYVYQKQRDPNSGINYNLKETTDLMNVPWTPSDYPAVEAELDYYWTVVTNYVPIEADATFLRMDIE